MELAQLGSGLVQGLGAAGNAGGGFGHAGGGGVGGAAQGAQRGGDAGGDAVGLARGGLQGVGQVAEAAADVLLVGVLDAAQGVLGRLDGALELGTRGLGGGLAGNQVVGGLGQLGGELGLAVDGVAHAVLQGAHGGDEGLQHVVQVAVLGQALVGAAQLGVHAI